MEGSDSEADSFFNTEPELVRHDKEEANVREKGDGKDVNKEQLFVEGKSGEGGTEDTEAFAQFLCRSFEDIFQSDLGTYRKT
jgi:hypothetical protein